MSGGNDVVLPGAEGDDTVGAGGGLFGWFALRPKRPEGEGGDAAATGDAGAEDSAAGSSEADASEGATPSSASASASAASCAPSPPASASSALFPSDPRPPVPSCKVHVLDLASLESAPRCDASDESVWPRSLLNASDWKTLMGVDYWTGQHSTNHWTSAAARALPTHTADEEAADLIVVDSSCLEARVLGQRFIAHVDPEAPKPAADPHERLVEALAKVQQRPRFKRRRGVDHLTSLHWPGYSMAIRRAFRLGGRAFVATNERALFGGGDGDNAELGIGVIEPYVAVENIPETPKPFEERTRLLFVAHGCADGNNPKQYASGKVMRGRLVAALNRLNVTEDHVISRCTCGVCPSRIPHDRQMREMEETRFCPVMPGDSQGTRHLSETFLAGCIPVFIGPPFATMPLAEHVDYAASSVFLSVRTKTWFFTGKGSNAFNHPHVADAYGIDALVSPRDIKHLETIEDAYRYLLSIPDDVVRSKLEAVKKYRPFFSHAPIPGEERSWLVDAVLNAACRVAEERTSYPPRGL